MKTLKPALQALVAAGLTFGVATTALSESTLEEVMKARGLTQKDVLAAAKTYTPTRWTG